MGLCLIVPSVSALMKVFVIDFCKVANRLWTLCASAAWAVQSAEVDYEMLLKGFPPLRFAGHSNRREVEAGLGHLPFANGSTCYTFCCQTLSCFKSKRKGFHLFCGGGMFFSLVVLAARRWFLILNPHFLLLNCITLNWVITPDHSKWLFFSTPTLCCYIWIWCTDYSEYK